MDKAKKSLGIKRTRPFEDAKSDENKGNRRESAVMRVALSTKSIADSVQENLQKDKNIQVKFSERAISRAGHYVAQWIEQRVAKDLFVYSRHANRSEPNLEDAKLLYHRNPENVRRIEELVKSFGPSHSEIVDLEKEEESLGNDEKLNVPSTSKRQKICGERGEDKEDKEKDVLKSSKSPEPKKTNKNDVSALKIDVPTTPTTLKSPEPKIKKKDTKKLKIDVSEPKLEVPTSPKPSKSPKISEVKERDVPALKIDKKDVPTTPKSPEPNKTNKNDASNNASNIPEPEIPEFELNYAPLVLKSNEIKEKDVPSTSKSPEPEISNTKFDTLNPLNNLNDVINFPTSSPSKSKDSFQNSENDMEWAQFINKANKRHDSLKRKSDVSEICGQKNEEKVAKLQENQEKVAKLNEDDFYNEDEDLAWAQIVNKNDVEIKNGAEIIKNDVKMTKNLELSTSNAKTTKNDVNKVVEDSFYNEDNALEWAAVFNKEKEKKNEEDNEIKDKEDKDLDPFSRDDLIQWEQMYGKNQGKREKVTPTRPSQQKMMALNKNSPIQMMVNEGWTSQTPEPKNSKNPSISMPKSTEPSTPKNLIIPQPPYVPKDPYFPPPKTPELQMSKKFNVYVPKNPQSSSTSKNSNLNILGPPRTPQSIKFPQQMKVPNQLTPQLPNHWFQPDCHSTPIGTSPFNKNDTLNLILTPHTTTPQQEVTPKRPATLQNRTGPQQNRGNNGNRATPQRPAISVLEQRNLEAKNMRGTSNGNARGK